MENLFKKLHLVIIFLFFISNIFKATGGECSSNSGIDQVVILINQAEYKKLRTEIEQFKKDVEINFPVQLTIVKGDWTKPEDVRTTIKRLYRKKALRGVVLVGAILMPKFHMQNINIPNLLYYEAFDMKFIDENGDGIPDAYVGVPDLKIWVANIRGVENESDPGIEVLKTFFQKTHFYYEGKQNIERRALAVTGTDWPDGANDFANKTGKLLFGSDNVDVLNGHAATQTALLDKFKNHTYRMFYIQVHSSATAQKVEGGPFTSKEISEIPTGALFIVNHGCSTCNWTEADLKGERNTGMSWIFGRSIGEAVICNVRTGMAYGQDSLYSRMIAGDYVGQAYFAEKKAGEWEMHNEYPDGNIVSGVTFIGNPFLYIKLKN